MKKKYFLTLTSFLSLFLILASCSTSSDVVSGSIISKRKVNKGYHFNLPSRYRSADQDSGNESLAEERKSAVKPVQTQIPAKAQVQDQIQKQEDSELWSENALQESESQETVVSRIETKHSAAQVASEEVKDQKSLKQELKANQKQFRKTSKKTSKHGGDDIVLLYILAIIIPFVAVGIVTNWDASSVLINILLCLLCGIPGIIHALIVVSRNG